MPFSQDDTNRIQAALKAALASSSLGQWERTFLGDMQIRFEKDGARTRLSPKQYAKLRQKLEPFRESRPTAQPPPVRTQAEPRPSKPRQAPRKPARRSPSPIKAVRRAKREMRVPVLVIIGIGMLFALIAGGSDPSNTGAVMQDRSASVSSAGFSVTDGDTVHRHGAAKGMRLVGFNTPETYKPQCDRELALIH